MNKLLLVVVLMLSVVQGMTFPGARAAERLELVYIIDHGVTAENVTYIREGLRLAEEYVRDALDTSMSGRLEITAEAIGSPDAIDLVGQAMEGGITYFTESAGWHFSSPVYRTEIVVHEFIHVYQGQVLGWNNWSIPAWMVEGMAEYLASEALIERGLLSRADAEEMRYWLIAGVQLGRLREYEHQIDVFIGGAPVYGLSYLGIASLLDGRDVELLGAFLEQVSDGADWERAFSDTFGITPLSFYTRFQLERHDFPEPSDPPPVYDLLIPVESASPVEITDLMDRVTVGEQLLMQGRSEPSARCILYLWGESLDLVLETTVDGASNLFWLVTIPGDTPPQTAEFSVDCGAGPIVAPVEIRARSRADDHRD